MSVVTSQYGPWRAQTSSHGAVALAIAAVPSAGLRSETEAPRSVARPLQGLDGIRFSLPVHHTPLVVIELL